MYASSHSHVGNLSDPTSNKVYRIHYLRADARYRRWREEETILSYEMVWTRRYFEHKAAVWKHHARGPKATTPGHRAYAYRQVAFWTKMASVAWNVFRTVNEDVEGIYGAAPGVTHEGPAAADT